jgi:predicted peptidase
MAKKTGLNKTQAVRRLEALVLGTTLALLAHSNRSWAADAGRQKSALLDRSIKVTMQYLVYLPKDYEQKESWPLMLFLHGSGERGDDLNLVKKHGPPKLIEAGRQFPFIVVSPQCPIDHDAWETCELSALLDEVVEKYKVDQDRIYVTGLSMGGSGAWALAIRQPDRFAAVVPICGGGDSARAKRIAHLPVWVFHGGRDPTVPLQESQKMVDALKKNGSDVQFTIYAEAKHDSWTEAYNTPELYAWLLQQKRAPSTRPRQKRN